MHRLYLFFICLMLSSILVSFSQLLFGRLFIIKKLRPLLMWHWCQSPTYACRFFLSVSPFIILRSVVKQCVLLDTFTKVHPFVMRRQRFQGIIVILWVISNLFSIDFPSHRFFLEKKTPGIITILSTKKRGPRLDPPSREWGLYGLNNYTLSVACY